MLLGVLAAVERDSAVTQRTLSRQLGIALGLTNAYLRRCVRKGLVKIRQVPANRYLYYLTPEGFAEKSRLTAEYFAVSFDFFRRARRDCAEVLGDCERQGWRGVALCGAGELAEITILSAAETALQIVCVIDGGQAGGRCAGSPIVADLAAARALAGPAALDGVILTDTRDPQASFERLCAAARQQGLAEARVVAPSLLQISNAAAALQPESAA